MTRSSKSKSSTPRKVASASSGQVYVVGSTEATQSFPGTGTLSPTPTVGFLTSLNPAGGPVAWTYTYATEITGLALGPGLTRLARHRYLDNRV